MSEDIRLSNLQDTVVSILEGNDYITTNTLSVVKATSLQDPEVNEMADTDGAVIVVGKPFEGDKRDQSGRGVVMDNVFLVGIKINKEVNESDGGKGINDLELVEECIIELVRNPRHPGGEYFQLQEPGWWTEERFAGYELFCIPFSKELTI